jgi:hypothetical protein
MTFPFLIPVHIIGYLGHFISPELEYPMICTGIRKGKGILYLLSLKTQ